MAEETDLSRTEPASPRRLQQARSAGDVPRSAELTAWAVLLSALGMLGWLAPRLLNALQVLTEVAFIHAAQPLSPIFIQAAWAALWAVLPVLGVIFAAALVAPILLSGWVFAPQAAQADLTRANPFKPFARLFSVESLFDGKQASERFERIGACEIGLGGLRGEHPAREQDGGHQGGGKDDAQYRQYGPERRPGSLDEYRGKRLRGMNECHFSQHLQGIEQARCQPAQHAQRRQHHGPRREFGGTRHVARAARLLQASRTCWFGTGKVCLLSHACLKFWGSLARSETGF